jgi:predicted TIM-barrel fold metal-dependent hydrolase
MTARIISTDDHVVEPADLWQERLPSKYRDIGPRIVRERASTTLVNGRPHVVPDEQGDWCDWWLYEDLKKPITVEYASVAAAEKADQAGQGTTYDKMRRGCYDPVERVIDMELNGIEASLCFPNTLPRFCGQTFLEAKDKELAYLGVRAYNDWMAEEWAGPSDGRLLNMSLVPLWDAELAAQEIYRNAPRGARAVSFSELPTVLGLPSIHSPDGYWEPFLRACQDTGTTICLHIGSSSQRVETSRDAPLIVGTVLNCTLAMSSMCDWLFSGIFERLPQLKVAFSEGNIGWVPYILERADRVWSEQRNLYDRDVIPRPPSEYYREHMFGCYISDQHGLDSVEAIGEDTITFETDYPHADSTWPNSVKVADTELAHLTPLQQEKILRTNAIRMLNLDTLHPRFRREGERDRTE